jgi:hypothetical protein
MPKLHGLQMSMTRWLRSETQAASQVTARPLPLPAAERSWLAAGTGPLHLLGSPDDLGTTKATKAAGSRRLERSLTPATPVSRRALSPRSTPEVALYAPPPQTRLPIGGAAAGGSGGLGSAAPPVAAVFAALALSLATIFFARFSLDLAPWRSTLLASRLGRPG